LLLGLLYKAVGGTREMNGIDMISYDIAFALGYFCHVFVNYLTRKSSEK